MMTLILYTHIGVLVHHDAHVDAVVGDLMVRMLKRPFYL